MALPPALSSFREHPEAHLPDPSLTAAIAYVLGYDAGVLGSLLVGFREWLVVRLDAPSELEWPALVECSIRRTTGKPSSEIGPLHAIESFLTELDTFLEQRGRRQGLREVWLEYDAHLRDRRDASRRSPSSGTSPIRTTTPQHYPLAAAFEPDVGYSTSPSK